MKIIHLLEERPMSHTAVGIIETAAVMIFLVAATGLPTWMVRGLMARPGHDIHRVCLEI